jgi:multidrug efflux system membrane fusion protein
MTRILMPRRWLLRGVNATAAAVLLMLAGCSGAGKQSAPPAAAAPVTIATVAQRDVPLELHAIGNVQAYATVQIKSQINAILEKANFKEGDEVRKGQLLFVLDARQLEADLLRSEGAHAKDKAQLVNAQAKAARYTQLLKEGVVSQQDYDEVLSAADALKAAVAADQADVEDQKVQLTYTKLYSPIDGRTGSLLVNVGNLVKANDVPVLLTINQVQPIYVNFALPEQQLAEVKKYAAAGTLKAQAVINGDAQNPVAGSLSFLDNAVDTTTGTIKMKAVFPNQDRRLWPGQFVDVALHLTIQRNAVLVPSVAVLTGQQGQYVYVVNPDLTVQNRTVIVTRNVGSDAVVDKGLNPGERVVTDGQVRLQPGVTVEIKNGSANAAGDRNANVGSGN